MNESPRNIFGVHRPEIIYDGDKFESIMYTVQFTIFDFKSTTKSVFKSPVFSVGNNNEFDAHISYSTNGPCFKNCSLQPWRVYGNQLFCVSIELVPKVANKNVDGPKGSASFFVQNDNKIKMWNAIASNRPITKTDKLCYAGACHCQNNIQQTLKTSDLTIKCQLKLEMVITLIGIEKPLVTVTADKGLGNVDSNLKEDLSSLIHNTDLADVTLGIGDRKIKVHKVILAARSPVFARMFQTEMVENQRNVVEISDMDFEVLQSLLVYMYTDNVPGLDTHGEALLSAGESYQLDGLKEKCEASLAEGLLSAAEKYQLDGLKEKCEASLAEGLTVENAARVFLVADLHRAKLLKGKVVEFINKNMEAVKKTEGWKVAKDEHQLVLAMTFL